MRLQAALSGDLDQMLADEVRIAEQAVTNFLEIATVVVGKVAKQAQVAFHSAAH